jgi:hypothetical protein
MLAIARKNADYRRALRRLCDDLAAEGWTVSGDENLDFKVKVSRDGKTWIKIDTGCGQPRLFEGEE